MAKKREDSDELDMASRSFSEKADEMPYDPWEEDEEVLERRRDPLRQEMGRTRRELEEEEL
jgi:hypothetical protein